MGVNILQSMLQGDGKVSGSTILYFSRLVAFKLGLSKLINQLLSTMWVNEPSTTLNMY